MWERKRCSRGHSIASRTVSLSLRGIDFFYMSEKNETPSCLAFPSSRFLIFILFYFIFLAEKSKPSRKSRLKLSLVLSEEVVAVAAVVVSVVCAQTAATARNQRAAVLAGSAKGCVHHRRVIALSIRYFCLDKLLAVWAVACYWI